MKRKPVKKDVSKKSAPKGVDDIKVTSGKIGKAREAAFSGGFGYGWNTFGATGMNTTVHNNSYANMGMGTGAFGDVPLIIAMLQQNNGGILSYPMTLRDKYQLYRYFARVDAYVSAAVKLNTDLPMSRLLLRMPKMKDKARARRIQKKYEKMVERLNLFEVLHSMLYEVNVIGNAALYVEFDSEKKEWSKISILPPEEVTVSSIPLSQGNAMIQYSPELINILIRRHNPRVGSEEEYEDFLFSLDDDTRVPFENLPYEFVRMLVENDGKISMDTSPYCGDGTHSIGSFCYLFTEKRHEYHDLGASPIESVLTPLLMKEFYKHTQMSLASRNMTPRNKIVAEGASPESLESLREQIDASMLNPDYSIITNFQWDWEQIGSSDRLIDLSREYDEIENQLFAGLGVSRELLMGESLYSGSKLTLEVLNTMCLLKRERLQRFVEDYLFKPVAEENLFYDIDEDNEKTYYFPKLSFSRLTIRDNAEVFDSLFQLYQKGSLPIDVIYDLFNLDSDDLHHKLQEDMFTVKDATYNEMLRDIYSGIANEISENTDLKQQMADSMVGPTGKKLVFISDGEEDEDDDYGGGGGGGDDFGLDDFGDEDSGMPDLPDMPPEPSGDISDIPDMPDTPDMGSEPSAPSVPEMPAPASPPAEIESMIKNESSKIRELRSPLGVRESSDNLEEFRFD